MAGLKNSQHLKLTFKEIEVATENFLTCIGKGGYGQVYRGELLIAGKHTAVAVKRLNENLGQGLKEFLTEIQLLTGQKHPNLVSLLGYCHEEREKIIVYEYAVRGSLDRYIRPSQTAYCLTWRERLKISVDAARGLDYLHSHVGKHQSIIHRDIKSANILLDDKWVAKISDFGLSKLSLSGLDRSAVITYACGTPGYCEPEYIYSGIVTKKSDVYSFGMVLFELLCGRLCTVKEDDGLFLSAKMVKESYQKSKLHEIVHPVLWKQMSTLSLYKFSKIAYECVQDDREERPPMGVVRKVLEETLKFELSQSGYLANGAVPTDNQPLVIQPIAIPAVQVNKSKKFIAVEVAPTDAQPIVVEPIGVPALQVDELTEVTDNFGVSSQIGEGLFGKVYLGVLRSGHAAAIKLLNSSTQPDHEFLAQVSRVSRLKHDNVVQMLGYCVDGGLRILAYEYASYGSLRDILHGRKGVKDEEQRPVLSWAQRVKIAVGAARGLEYLHETAQPNIVHRDIKSSNVLLFDDDVAKIGDFDLSNQAPDMSERTNSTRAFNFGSHAPEYALTGQLDSKSDIYSFGVVLLELFTGRKPVDHTLPRGKQSLVTWATPMLTEDKFKQCIDTRLNGNYPPRAAAKMAAVAALCVQYEPEFRPFARILVKMLQPLLNTPRPPPSPPRAPAAPLPTPIDPPSEVSHLRLFMCCCGKQA
ncbi:hypothetical protein QVD17_15288 [Tagetes erecta]|uniref:Protein kinase domain-containing protein n=1 Tax=Tagetes erecta TaxID=13708 RepID=A0AAD8KUM2_TARER|nr:hypothetical protein QVD17_15288 [Tagetes erecta]